MAIGKILETIKGSKHEGTRKLIKHQASTIRIGYISLLAGACSVSTDSVNVVHKLKLLDAFAFYSATTISN